MDTDAFLSILAVLLAQYYPEEVAPSQKPIDSAGCIPCRKTHYDFIIVGAGTAGPVLANRLTENPEWNVLLLEAGGDEDFITRAPALRPISFNPRYTWNYTTTPQERLCLALNGACDFPRGYLMGGSSSLNGMINVRSNPEDYDNWESLGNPGWSYKDVLPYFLKLENMTIPELAADTVYHSTFGPMPIAYSRSSFLLNEDFIKAGEEYGLNEVDYNAAKTEGIANIQLTLKGPTRCSVSKAYIEPIRFRPNLYIFKHTLGLEVLFDEKNPKKAIGIRCKTNGEEYNVYAKKEVILSAGVINTPILLISSGIGPKEHLEELNIPLIADLPVGDNLADHIEVAMFYEFNNQGKDICKPLSKQTAYDYAKFRTGNLSSVTTQVIAFIEGQPENETLLGSILFGVYCDYFNTNQNPPVARIQTISIANTLKAIGNVRMSSKNVADQPKIDPKYFSSDFDLHSAIWIMRETIKFMSTPTMMQYSPKLIVDIAPECMEFYDDNENISDEYLECYAIYRGESGHHPVGTARMGPISDKTTVVDSTFKVHTFQDLRVIDGSTMPRLTRGNPNTPTIMMAEKASDIIKKCYNF